MVSVSLMIVGLAVGFGTVAWGADAVVTLTSGGGLDFSPKKVVIRVGERVIWNNPTGDVHSVTSFATESGAQAAGGNPEINELIKPGAKFSHRFRTAGSYFYYCPIHQGMWGTVVVKN
jgi:plastocyanin